MSKERSDLVGLEIDAKTKEWRGELPKNCRNVYIQWFVNDHWEGILGATGEHSRPVHEARTHVEMAIRKGPLQFNRYRLMPVTKTIEGEHMAKQKKSTATKAAKAPKAPAELVGGELRAGSFNAILYTALEDGRTHTLEALEKLVPKCKNVAARLVGLRKRGMPVSRDEKGNWALNGRKKSIAAVPTTKAKAATKKVATKSTPVKPASTEGDGTLHIAS